MEPTPRSASPSHSPSPTSRRPLPPSSPTPPRNTSTGSAPIAAPSVPIHEPGILSNVAPRRLFGSREILEARRRQEEICQRKFSLINRLVAEFQAVAKGKMQRTAARKLVWPVTNVIKSMEASGIRNPTIPQIDEFLTVLARNERDPLMQQQIAETKARLGHPNITLGLAQYHGDKARGIDIGAALYREAMVKAAYAEQSRAKKAAQAEGEK